MQWLKKTALKVLAFLLGNRVARWMARLLNRRLVEQLRGEATEELLFLLLKGMDGAFALFKDYRRNIEDWRAVLVFRTSDPGFALTARFVDGDLRVEHGADPAPTVTVEFTDAAAVRRFLFSQSQDILDSVLHNEVHLEGNFNYVYRFGFLARDLEHRLLGTV